MRRTSNNTKIECVAVRAFQPEQEANNNTKTLHETKINRTEIMFST